MKITKYLLWAVIAFTLNSCAQMMNGAILPNQCKKCELLDAYNGNVLFMVEGCGSENTRLEEQCKEKAWELSRGKSLCDFELRCDSWRKDPE